MVRSVQVFRREDGLPLVATSDAGSAQLDRDFPSHRETFKSILSNFPRITEEMSTVEAPSNYCFHILVPADGKFLSSAF